MKTAELIYSQGKSQFSYPYKVLYRDTEVGKEHLIISVPKKIYKRAVKRNLIRRRIREAFRLNCKDLPNIQGKDLLLVYVSSHIMDYGKITETLISAISKVGVDS